MTAIAHRATIDEIGAQRDRAVELYAKAYDLWCEALQAVRAAAPAFTSYSMPEDAARALRSASTAGRADFLAAMTKVTDQAVWRYLIDSTGLDRLMDATAREQFRAQLDNPPPATADNCFATMSQLVEDADLIFKRGVATTFSRLDRRFRSHDGFKIGSRMVLDAMLGLDGWWNSYRRHDDTLVDVERAFALLDGKPQPERDAGIVGAIKLARESATGGRFRPAAFEAESDYFRVKVFKNGNAHVWFKRDDLLKRVNLLLADYYGASLGAAPDVADRKHAANRTPAKNFGFFETPTEIARQVLEAAGIVPKGAHSPAYNPEPFSVLEPSAGRGAIARQAAEAPGARWVTCVEIQAAHAAELKDAGVYARVVHGDFLDQSPEALGTFDRIVMNPPFDGGRDVDHVTHALRFLKPGGRLAAVMAAGVEFREDAKTAAFRDLVERYRGRFFDLPPGSFAASGTLVNTVVVTITAPTAPAG